MSETDAKATIWAHVSKIGICMMIARDGSWVRARPMRGIAKPEMNEIWFITDSETSIAGEVTDDPRCCLTYCDTKAQAYVSLSGEMNVVDDPASARALWSDGADSYFPNGPEDPAVVLLKFVPEIAQYWESPSSPILIAISFLQAKLNGQRPALGSSGTAQLS